MQRRRTIMTALALVGLLCTAVSFAQQREPLPGHNPQVPLVKATTFIESAVVNGQGENLGKIDDLVIDPVTGSITYAALSYGRIFGMGGKLLAVPWKVLELQPDGTSFLLNLPKKTLEKAVGFDKNNWPQRPDPMLSTTMRQPETRAGPVTIATPGTGVAATVQIVNPSAQRLMLKTQKDDSMELQAPTGLRITTRPPETGASPATGAVMHQIC